MKTQINFFVSYAHNDLDSCERLLELLRVQMAPSAKYEFQLWDDRLIIAGEAWKDEIEKAIAECHLGLLCVSPSFLGSEFITNKELPAFVGDAGKAAIPVEVQSVNFKTHDMKGLQDQQLFRLDREAPFGKCAGKSRQTRFAEQLYQQIEARLRKLGY